MDILQELIKLFIANPARILVVAGVLLLVCVGCYFAKRRVPASLVIAALSWLSFAPWEYYCMIHPQYNIRLDLGVIMTWLLFFTLVGLWGLVWTLIDSDSTPRDGSD